MISRREFLIKGALAGVGTFTAVKYAQGQELGIAGANDRVRIGVIGLNARGCRNLSEFAALPNVEIAALCDPDSEKLREAFFRYSKDTARKPLIAKDPRRLFDLTELDALCISSPLLLRSETVMAAVKCGKNVFADGPIFTSISGARKLADIAEKEKCLIGQNENVSFRPARSFAGDNRIFDRDFTSVIGSANFNAHAGKRVPSNNPRSGNGRSAADYLPESTYELLDVSRNILNVGTPTLISAIDSGMGRKALDVEFIDRANRRKNLILELLPGPDHGGVYNRGSLTFFSTGGSFEMDSIGPATAEINRNCFENYISCLRNNSPDALQNPFSEARKSIAILHLAKLSFQFRRNIKFDPATEAVVNDTEINRHL